MQMGLFPQPRSQAGQRDLCAFVLIDFHYGRHPLTHKNDDAAPTERRSTSVPRCVATARRNGAGTALAIISCLSLLALLGSAATPATPPPSFPESSLPPVTSFRVYRAIDSRLLGGSLGDAGTHLENTDAGSAGGVLGYLHSEVVPSSDVPGTGRRFNDIDAIAVFEVRVLNVRRARLFASNDPPGDANLFGPYMAFNRGMAMPPRARDQIASYGAYVGIQDQGHNPRHAYPGDWYSFVGACPFSHWVGGQKPSPCPTTPALDGICHVAGTPDGTPLCQYSYSYCGYVPLDDLVGITSKSEPLCRTGRTPRPCADYADFRRSGGVEYAAGPDDTMECADAKGPESGLPFWRGRCDPEKAMARMRILTDAPLVMSAGTAKAPRAGRRG